MIKGVRKSNFEVGGAHAWWTRGNENNRPRGQKSRGSGCDPCQDTSTIPAADSASGVMGFERGPRNFEVSRCYLEVQEAGLRPRLPDTRLGFKITTNPSTA